MERLLLSKEAFQICLCVPELFHDSITLHVALSSSALGVIYQDFLLPNMQDFSTVMFSFSCLSHVKSK